MTILDSRALNRATLARQLLLDHADLPVIDAVAHLCGLQAQEPQEPFVGLWSRLRGFDPAALSELLTARRVVRTHLMRRTIHLVTADDVLAWRARHGWVNDVAPVYAWSHATFLPSHSETMPYAAIESVRCGRPVALPALGYFSDVGAEDTLIHRFTPGDPSSAVAALRRALAQSGRGREVPAVTGGPFDPARWRRRALARYGLKGAAGGDPW